MRALGKGSVASVMKVVLTIGWWALALGLGALIVAALAYAAVAALAAAGIVDPDLLSADGGGEFRVSSDDGAMFARFDNLIEAWPIVTPALTIGFVALGGALIIVDRLRRLFDSFTSGEPFRRENANHLRAIWITMLVMELARFGLMGVIAGVFAAGAAPVDADASFNVSVDLSTWLSIAVLIVLAEVFREGARLKEEQELTI